MHFFPQKSWRPFFSRHPHINAQNTLQHFQGGGKCPSKHASKQVFAVTANAQNTLQHFQGGTIAPLPLPQPAGTHGNASRVNATKLNKLPQPRQRDTWRHESSSAVLRVMECYRISPCCRATQFTYRNKYCVTTLTASLQGMSYNMQGWEYILSMLQHRTLVVTLQHYSQAIVTLTLCLILT